MPVTLFNYSVSRSDPGLVSFLFPNQLIFIDHIPAFPPSNSFILLSDKSIGDNTPYSILRIPFSSPISLNDRMGFLTFMKDKGYKIADPLREYFKTLSDEDYWREVKLFYVSKIPPKAPSELTTNIFHLFKSLFNDFRETYKIYVELSTPHPVVFNSLLTMMAKTLIADDLDVHIKYKQILKTHRTHVPKFRKAVVSYLVTSQRELDFIKFLMRISKH